MYSFECISDHGYVVVGTKEARFSISPGKFCNGIVNVQIFQDKEEAFGAKGVYSEKGFYRYFEPAGIIKRIISCFHIQHVSVRCIHSNR